MKHEIIPTNWRQSVEDLRQEMSHSVDRWLSKIKPEHDKEALDFKQNPLFNLSLNPPQIDVEENDGTFIITAEIPGLKKEDLDVQLNEHSLTLSGKKESKREQKHGKTHYSERSYGAFSRTIPLPCSVNRDEVKAKYRRGILKLTLPKNGAVKGRRIDVGYENET